MGICVWGIGDCGGDEVSTSSSTSSQSGAAQTGDASNANVITGNDGNVTVDNSQHTQVVDPGIIKTGLTLSESAEAISKAALTTVPLITTPALETVREVVISNENIAGDAFRSNEIVSKDALDLGRSSLITVENVVTAAGGFGQAALGSVDNAVITVENVAEDALGFGKDSLGFGKDSLDTVESSVITVENVAKDALSSNEIVAKDAFDVVKGFGITLENIVGKAIGAVSGGYSDLTDSVDDITASSERIAKEALFTSTTNSKIVAESLVSTGELIAATSNNTINALTDLEASRSIDTSNVLDAVATLGATVATGGENLKQDLNKVLIGGVVLVLGVVAWQAVRS